jgi:ribosome maturation factor RimP
MSEDRFKQALTAIEPLVQAEGAKIYDLELPQGNSGVLRVYVYSGTPKNAAISLDECANIARRILDLENIEELIPGNATLEVSSPGVNRKLRTEDQFRTASGERVRVAMRELLEGRRIFKGTVANVSEKILTLLEEDLKGKVAIPIAGIKEARVDFVF